MTGTCARGHVRVAPGAGVDDSVLSGRHAAGHAAGVTDCFVTPLPVPTLVEKVCAVLLEGHPATA